MLRAWRHRWELTHEEASWELEISRETYTRIERGAYLPKLELAILINDVARIPFRAWIER